MFSAGLVAYAAHKKQDKDLAHHAWQLLLDPSQSHTPLPIKSKQVTSWKDINEIPWVTTNTISQWCLNVMMCMVFIGDMLPEDEIGRASCRERGEISVVGGSVKTECALGERRT